MLWYYTRDLSKNGWSRSSRTDKGVHAIGCSVACKLVVPLAALEENAGHFSAEILEEINTHLPASIRLVDGYRVSKVRTSSLLKRLCILHEQVFLLRVFSPVGRDVLCWRFQRGFLHKKVPIHAVTPTSSL